MYFQLPYYCFSNKSEKKSLKYYTNVSDIATEFEFNIFVVPKGFSIKNVENDIPVEIFKPRYCMIYCNGDNMSEDIVYNFIKKIKQYDFSKDWKEMKDVCVNFYNIEDKINNTDGIYHFVTNSNQFGEVIKVINPNVIDDTNYTMTFNLFTNSIKLTSFENRNKFQNVHIYVDPKFVGYFYYQPTFTEATILNFPEPFTRIDDKTIVFTTDTKIYWIILKRNCFINEKDNINKNQNNIQYTQLEGLNKIDKNTLYNLMQPMLFMGYEMKNMKIRENYILCEDAFSYIFIGKLEETYLYDILQETKN